MAVRVVGISALTAATTSSFIDKSLLPAHAKPAAFQAQLKSLRRRPATFVKEKAGCGASFTKNPQLLSLLLPFLSYAGNARALEKEEVVEALSKVVDAYQRIGAAASTAYGVSKEVFDKALKVLSPAMDAAMPYVQRATDAAVEMASPVASDVTDQAEKALKSAGVDPVPVVEAAKSAAVVAGKAAEQTSKTIEGAKPIASATIDSLSSSDPIVLLEGAGILILLYLLLPRVLSSIAFSVRGYKGDLTPAQALELLTKQDYVMVDIRSEKEKSKAGIPSLPRSARSKLYSIPIEELSNKLKGMVRSSRKVEAEIAALKISCLKRLNRGSKLVIMDSYGDVAKTVARALTALGFKNTWVLNDGFSGGKGWLQSCLGTDSYSSSFAEILSPSRIIPGGRSRFGTQETPSRLLAGGD
eukprot:TRINITY_DN3186_c0_g1_i1.p1 TRINITY_DN3186_c0_g1~~TRINITY_DN3186_c0_g1_i1.p1  ORF type:complete len:463 (+),score=105.48 TRINITY_DN3186_c0_g1_i1:150-1391(+)